jgi:hypothetical protein
MVEACSNVASAAGMRVYYGALTKTVGGHVKQDVLDGVANAIGTVLRDRGTARSAYDELTRRNSSGESISPAELRAVMKRVETLLAAVAKSKAIVSSAKVHL